MPDDLNRNSSQLLQQMLMLMREQSQMQRRQYNGIMGSGSVYGNASGGIQSALSGMLPFGQSGLGSLASQMVTSFMMGKPYSPSGSAINPLSATPWQTNGMTYSGAVMDQMLATEQRGQASFLRTQITPVLKRSAFEQAYRTWNPSQTNEQVQAGVDAWVKDPISVPNLVSMAADPAEIRGITSAIGAAGSRVAGYGRYASGSTRSTYALGSRMLMQGMRDAATQTGSAYGGFSQRGRSDFMATYAAASDPFEGVTSADPRQLQAAVKAFTERSRSYLQALAPLRDVFGNDVPALISALSGMTGQRLGNISSGVAGRLATGINDTLRYTGTSMDVIERTTGQIRSQMAVAGAGSLQQIGAGNVALQSLNMVAGRRTPIGMTAEAYANQISRSMVSSASSQGAGYMANAYGLWVDKMGGDFSKYTPQAFQAATGGRGVDGAMQLLGLSNRQQLGAGSGTRGAFHAKQTGAFASLGLQEQAGQAIRSATAKLLGDPYKLNGEGGMGGEKGLSQVMGILSGKHGGTLVSGSSQGIEQKLIDLGIAKDAGHATRLANGIRTVVSTVPQVGGYLAAASNKRDADAVAASTSALRTALKSQDFKTSGDWQQALNLIGNTRIVNGKLQMEQGSRATVANHLMVTLSGSSDTADGKLFIDKFREGFGDKAGPLAMELATGRLSKSKLAQQALGEMRQSFKSTDAQGAKKYWTAKKKMAGVYSMGQKQAQDYYNYANGDLSGVSDKFKDFIKANQNQWWTPQSAKQASALVRRQAFLKLAGNSSYKAGLSEQDTKIYQATLNDMRKNGKSLQQVLGDDKLDKDVKGRFKSMAQRAESGAAGDMPNLMIEIGGLLRSLMIWLENNPRG